jgi:hypothetical protein
MAVDSNALTLSEYAVMSNSPLVQKITVSLLEMGNLLQDIPLVNKKTMLANGTRWTGDNLPVPNWAKLNEEPAATKGKPTPFQEAAYLLRNSIDVDKKIVEDENAIVDPRGAQIDAYLRAFTYDWNFKFINNNHVTGDEDAPVGLRYRLDNPTEYGVESEMKINGGGVVMTTAMAAADANSFIELLDQLLDYMGAPDGKNVVIYLNDTLKRRFARAIRVLGAGAGFSMVQDAFGRTVEMYRGAVIRDCGRKADQSTRIITATETAAGVDGASNYTSLYAVRYGENSFLGWQYEELDQSIRDLGLLDSGVITRIVVDWAVGLWQEHTRAVGRIYNIKVS